ncbi:MAG: mechanosensitive ion channel [Lachnospiraceae bacterium]|nr:mechanosensitive ion channel [Lachnospiraceae bacterium]
MIPLINNIACKIGTLLTEVAPDGETVSVDTVSENTVSGNVLEQLGQVENAEDLKQELNVIGQMLAELPDKLARFAFKFIIALIIFFIATKIIKLVRKIVKRSLIKGGAEAGVIQFLDSLLKVILYLLLIAGFMSYFGIETASLITVIGSAGVAFALALQGSLSNFTGGVLLLLLKPFKVGDYIVEDKNKNEGTVLEIKLFYTKLRTVDDRIVILPNGDLANSSLTNLHLSPNRRVCLTVGISYKADIRKAKAVIEQCIKDDKYAIPDGVVDVYVSELASSSVNISFRYYVKNDDYFASRWAILEEVKYAFDENGIEIPYNQLDVHTFAEK